MHIYASAHQVIISSDNGLSLTWHQAIICTNAAELIADCTFVNQFQ